MKDLRDGLRVMSERGTPIGSRRLREQVALKLAGSTGGVVVGHDPQTTPSRRWWQRPAVVVTAAALGVLVLIGGTALLTLQFAGGDGPADQTTPVTTTAAATTTTGTPTTTTTAEALQGYVGTTFAGPGVLDTAGAVCCLVAAPDGTVWLGVSGVGLASFDGEQWRTYSEAEGFPGTAGSVDVAPDGTVWAGTSVWAPDGRYTTDSWVVRFDGETWTTRVDLQHDPGGTVRVAAAPDGTVRAGYPGGYIGFMIEVPHEGSVGAWRSSGQSWWEGGLFFWGDIAVGADGTVWGYAKSDSDKKGGLIRLTEAGFVLVGTGEVGWVNGDGDKTPFRDLAVGADGTVWIATSTAAINRFDGETWVTYSADGLVPPEPILWVEGAADGRVWFGTEAGLLSFDGQAWAWDPVGPVSAFAAGSDGTLWAVIGEHLVRYTPAG